MAKHRTHSIEFKRQVAQEFLAGETLHGPAKRHDVCRNLIRVAVIVQETLRRDPHSGHLFVFRGRRGSLIKCLWSDGQGLCLFSKRLERGRFLWPSLADGTVTISTAQLSYLLSGIDWRMPQETWRPRRSDRRKIG